MPFLPSSADGARLHYIDYTPIPNSTSSPPRFQKTSDPKLDFSNTDITLVFVHGWPMSSLMYEHLMLPLCETNGIRCVAVDRRGFGGSEWSGTKTLEEVTYETFARDTLDVLTSPSLSLGEFVFVAASMGCGETLLTYNMMDETTKALCKGFIWLGPALPFPLQTPANPTAPSRELWDMILTGFRQNRAGFVKASLPGVFGVGNEVDESILARFEYIIHQADGLAIERCVQIITNRDFTAELEEFGRMGERKEGLKILVVHGDSDQSAPFEATSKLVGELIPSAEIKVYKGASHGLYLTHRERVLGEVISFVARVCN